MEKTEAKAGDLVELALMNKEYEGTLLESSEAGIVLLKLDSGYNIGFPKKEVISIKVLDKFKSTNKEIKIPKSKEKPGIAMIITGGTIAAKLNSRKGGVDWLESPEELFKYYPEIFEKVNVLKVEVPFMKASEDMDFRDWQKIARVAARLLDDSNIKGVIVTHGTDFLHYTSAALSFMLRDLKKPVVLTYSQRSIDRASSDANLNLQCSALAAISDIAEVMLVGHATENDDYCNAMPGTKVRKLHSSRRDAFRVVNAEAFAKIYPDKIVDVLKHNLRNKGKTLVDAKFEEKVALVKIYPGQDPKILDFYAKEKYKGIVLEMSGLGHAPGKRAKKSWLGKLKELKKKRIAVCAVTQCINGRVDPWVYSNGRELMETGIIYLGDMLAETAFVKLGWVLGHESWAKNYDTVKEKMLENFAGEISKRLEF